MPWGMAAVAAATVVAGAASQHAAKKAANQASSAQERAAQMSIDEQQRQFNQIQEVLKPYQTAGTGAVQAQQNLLGLGGPAAQQAAINAIQSGPQYQAMQKAGENAILSNASATGGLRGGNTQGALAQFSPQLLGNLINQQFSQLGGLTQTGANAAAMQGQAGQNFANQYSAGQGQIGAAQAGNALAQGKATGAMWNLLPQAVGAFTGGGGSSLFSGMGSSGGGGIPLSSTPQASYTPGTKTGAAGSFNL